MQRKACYRTTAPEAMGPSTVMIFKDGQMVARIVGAQPKQAFTGKIDAVLAG